MKIGLAIEQLAAAEAELADELVDVGDRHKTDHDVFHLTKTLAKMERGHLDSLAPHAKRYEAEIESSGEDAPGSSRPVRTALETGARLAGRRSEPALLLLRDLRKLHLLAAGVSLDWVALGQAAQTAKDSDLLDAVSTCHPQTLKTLKWTTYRLKEAAPQALTS
jgi:hypothetical protein